MDKRKVAQQAGALLVVFMLSTGILNYGNLTYQQVGEERAASVLADQNVSGEGLGKLLEDQYAILASAARQSELEEAVHIMAEEETAVLSIAAVPEEVQKAAAVEAGMVEAQITAAPAPKAEAAPTPRPKTEDRSLVASRGSVERQNILVPWFGGVEHVFAVGTDAIVTDVDTGIRFRARRTGGTNHSDTETPTVEDTQLLKKIFGGSWNWERRAVIVTVGSRKFAGSMTGMPHAGRDDMPARINVSNRSAGYGWGINYDSIKGNGMDGHFDIHFLNSRTHGTNRVDEKHQAMVRKAAASYGN